MSPKVESTVSVTPRGAGKRDYSRDIWMARVYSGVELRYNETFKMFQIAMSDIVSYAPHVIEPLPPGETVSLIDVMTGFPMPYTIAQGHTWRFLSNHWSFDQRGRTKTYFETVFMASAFPDTLGTFLNQPVAPLDTATIDPTGAAPHLIEYQLENIDVANLKGFWILSSIERIVGSPPFPDIKTVKCKWCGAEADVPAETTWYTCDKCEKKTFFFPQIVGRQ